MVSVEPVFVVSDVARAVAHHEHMGFSASHHDDAGYGFAHRNELTIHLAGLGVGPDRVMELRIDARAQISGIA
jgi:hypothetical protein